MSVPTLQSLTLVGRNLRLPRLISNAPMNWALADQIVNSAQNFAIGLAVARLAGIEAFGAFTLVFVISLLIALLHDDFLAAPMMTYAGGKKRRTPNYFSGITISSLVLALAGGLAVGLIVCAMMGYRDGALPIGLALTGAAATAANSHFVVMKRILFARDQARQAFMLSIVRITLLFSAVPPLWFAGFDLSAEVWIGLIAVSATLAALPVTLRHLPTRSLRPSLFLPLLSKHWSYARWLLLMVAVSMGQEQFVWLWVGALEGNAAVGGMRAGQYLLGLTHVIMIGMHNFIALEAARAFSRGGHDGLRGYLGQQTLILGLLVGGLLVCLALFAETWMRLVFGPDFVRYAATLRWFCLIYAVVFVREVWAIYLRTLEETRAIFLAFAASSLFAIIATYPAIKFAGIGGALAVVLIAHTISLALIAAAIITLRRMDR
jgi:O-antigen/teichoic acid export membrane protein